MNDQSHGLDLHSLEAVDTIDVSTLPEGAALGTWGTTSTASTASCPISSAGSVMTAS
ncbi:MAG: thiocillin family RiPP [Nocardioides sp.]